MQHYVIRSIFDFIRYDLLYVRDGLNFTSPTIGPVTGYKPRDQIATYESSGEGVLINFVSWNNVRTRGFQLWYEKIGKI